MKNNWVFWISLVISFALIVAGFLAPPMGVIDNSVLIAVGMLLGKSVDKSKHNGNYLSNSYLIRTLCEFTNLSLKELWDKGNNYLHPSYSSISKAIHRENNQIILENLEGNLGKSDLEQLQKEMLEINLAYIPILREYKDILSKIVKQLIFK